MWILLAATCSTLNAVSGALTKRLVERSSLLASTFLIALLSLPVFLVLAAVRGVPAILPGFWLALAVNVGINLVVWPLRNLALRLSPLSLTIPFLALTPLFLLITEALFLGDRPGARGMAGVGLIVAGAYALNLGRGGPLAPFRAIARERGSLIMLGVAAAWSVTSVFDKICILKSSPTFYLASFHFLYAAGSLPMVLARKSPAGRTLRREWRLLALIALATAGTMLAQMAALELTLVSYVIAIKRAGMLLSVILGAIFFGEKDPARRFVGSALMAAGVAFIVFD
jgi:drug/metabolite transporter (DMT)-like permease